jgi:predicted nucleotidyltransferase
VIRLREEEIILERKMQKEIYPKMSNITLNGVICLEAFLSDYKGKKTASEVARIIKLPQQTASRELNKLAESGRLEYEIKGKNKLFFLDFNKQTSRVLIEIAELKKSFEFMEQHNQINLIINSLIKSSESIVIFGSYASGKQKEDSDLDMAIFEVRDKKIFLKECKEFDIKISPHFINYKEFGKLLENNNPLAIEIMKNHIIFGESSKIIAEIIKNG